MKTVYRFLVFSILASLTGCITVQSNTKSDAIPPTFSRVLIVTKMRNAPNTYVQQFARVFPAGYEVCTLGLSPLSFDKPEEAIHQQISDCHSEVILTLELSRAGQASRYGRRLYSTAYEFNAEMESVATGQPFWKAIISSDASYGEQVPPRAVIKKLLEDHIITGKIPPGSSLQAAN